MDILISDLHKYRTGISQQITSNNQSIAKIRQIAVDAIAPRITKSFNLLWLSSNVRCVAVLDVTAGC